MKDTIESQEDAVTVPFLREFIRSQHRSFQQLQITAVILMMAAASSVGVSAATSFANDAPSIGWICIAVIVCMAALIVGWLVLLAQRTALVREVIAAPVDEVAGD